MPIRPVTPPLWKNTLDLTAATIPPGSTLTPQAGAGGGTVTAVTGTAPIASSGGTAPNISLNNSAVTPGSYGDATHVAAVTVDAHGLVTTASTVAITGLLTVLAAVGSSPNANAATLSAGTLNLEPANETYAGVLKANDYSVLQAAQHALCGGI